MIVFFGCVKKKKLVNQPKASGEKSERQHQKGEAEKKNE
jgi:hypothetical protein